MGVWYRQRVVVGSRRAVVKHQNTLIRHIFHQIMLCYTFKCATSSQTHSQVSTRCAVRVDVISTYIQSLTSAATYHVLLPLNISHLLDTRIHRRIQLIRSVSGRWSELTLESIDSHIYLLFSLCFLLLVDCSCTHKHSLE